MSPRRGSGASFHIVL